MMFAYLQQRTRVGQVVSNLPHHADRSLSVSKLC